MHKLEAKNIAKIIKKTQILYDISLEVNSGETVGLLGPNGAGKTTTFYTICGLIDINDGQILLDNKDITELLKDTGAYKSQDLHIIKDLANYYQIAQGLLKDIDKEQDSAKKNRLLENLLKIQRMEMALLQALAIDPRARIKQNLMPDSGSLFEDIDQLLKDTEGSNDS